MAYPNTGETTISKVAKAATIQSAVDDFDPVIGRLETLANRINNCADRIVGGRPSEVENRKDDTSPNHLIFSIQARRDRLCRVVDHIEAEIQRIENGLA